MRESAEVHYYFRVVLPCICVYRKFPIAILRKARTGDLKAIEQLIRLDRMGRMGRDDKVIARWIDGPVGRRPENGCG